MCRTRKRLPRMVRSLTLPLAIVLSLPVCDGNRATAEEPWPRHTIDDSSRGADGVRLGDFNADGRLDIVTPWEEGGVIRLYLQPEPDRVRQHWPAVNCGLVRRAEDAVPVDLDGDGQLDVVSCCEGRTRTVYVHWAPQDRSQLLEETAWTTEPIPATEQVQAWMFALPLQVDGRHGVDLVLGAKGGGSQLGWLESPAEPRQLADWRWHSLRETGWIMSLLVLDLNADHRGDILFTDRKGPRRGIYALLHPGREALAAGKTWEEVPLGGQSEELMFCDQARFHNQRQAIITATRNGHILCSTASGDGDWHTTKWSNPLGVPHGKAVALGDLDGDGRLDLVHAANTQGDRSAPGVAWTSSRDAPLTSDKQRQWHTISGADGVKFDLLQLLDLDHDGDLDILTCEERDGLGVFWYENRAAQ